MSNLWFFRLRSGSTTPISGGSMERRRSSSERGNSAGGGNAVASVNLLSSVTSINYSNYSTSVTSVTANTTTTTFTTGSPQIRIISNNNNTTTTHMSRLHSARSSTASYANVFASGGGSGFYGDVPPLHRRSFLGPGTSNLPLSDSQDNIAQLIPRLVES